MTTTTMTMKEGDQAPMVPTQTTGARAASRSTDGRATTSAKNMIPKWTETHRRLSAAARISLPLNRPAEFQSSCFPKSNTRLLLLRLTSLFHTRSYTLYINTPPSSLLGFFFSAERAVRSAGSFSYSGARDFWGRTSLLGPQLIFSLLCFLVPCFCDPGLFHVKVALYTG